jgi:hypothetical protein
MLNRIKALTGHKLAALDGAIGHVKDFYFDDHSWGVRFLVVDTGDWMPGRLVLLTPHALGRWDREEKVLCVNLTKDRIEQSPSIESHQPVSRQYEVDYYRYYGWPAYWDGAAMWGLGEFPVVLPPSKDELDALQARQRYRHPADRHLRSALALRGYAVAARDGPVGEVRDFLVDDLSWAIRELAVEAGHWYAGKEVLIAPAQVEGIDDDASKITLRLTQADIRETAAHHLAHAAAGDSVPKDFPRE